MMAFYELASASTGTGKNLTSKIDLDTFTASADCIVRPYVKLSSLNGAAATVTLYARHTTSGDATLGEFSYASPKPTTTDTVYSGNIPSDGVPLANGEKLVISAWSTNASDTGAAYAIVWVNAAGADVRAWVGTDAVAGAIPAVAAGATGGLADYDTANNAYSEIQLIANGTTVIRANNHTGSNIPDQQEVADAMKLLPSGNADSNSVIGLLNAIDPLTAQETADALKLAPTAGAPASGSVYHSLTNMPASVWASGTRTLTSFGTLVADTASATVTALVALTTATVTASTGFLKYIHTSLASLLSASTGTGDTAVDSTTLDTDGDDMAFKTSGGAGIDGAIVRAYVSTEYTASPTTATIRAQATTASDGSWGPIYLNSGTLYRITIQKDGYQLATTTVTPS